MRQLVIALVGLTAGLALLAPAASAIDASDLERALSRRMPARAGAHVVDAGTGRVLFSRNARVPRVPASNQKILTTAAALRRFGPATRLRTELRAGSRVRSGVLRGTLYLRGIGDPTLSVQRLEALAAALVQSTRLRRVVGPVAGDDTYFDRVRGTPYSNGAFNTESGFLGSLVLGRAFQRSPATRAALLLHRSLRRLGVRIEGPAVARATPEGTQRLARTGSPTIADIARFTNVPSDNFLAEMLVKGLGARYGTAGTTAAGAAVVRRDLRRLGVSVRAADGSGLSRMNRVSPHELVDLLRELRAVPRIGAPFRASLPVAGRSGTLAGRMRGSAAQDRCQAKTGTLIAVSALSGYCTTTAGRTVMFSLLMTGFNVSGLRQRQDAMVAAIAQFGS